ncbi:MAG TPA: DUF1287 domain-containing protein [Fimbriimonadaceae bacterium]|nr:DUF1287 domain-containing protein [Fimbriimonadaceae bacterium]HRE93761.1 DUF1287 domain-containing protein [Fimbriimonadaceae bacterium]HRI73711.1 DUF1287 domain-containing protein [Fimbriimonadaceae bacterium]
MSTVWVLAALGAGFASPSTQPGLDIVRNARKQVGVTTSYDPAYVRLSYPGGDVSKNTGVCTDVVVRALRPLGYDLQELIHEDWRANRRAYGGGQPDQNIDHRRVVNQQIFFARRGKRLAAGAAYAPGDFVAWKLPNGRLHIGVVSDRKSGQGFPLIIHNIGRGAQEEDVLKAWDQIGHYRWFNSAR